MEYRSSPGVVDIRSVKLRELDGFLFTAHDMGYPRFFEIGPALFPEPVEIGLCAVEPVLNDIGIYAVA